MLNMEYCGSNVTVGQVWLNHGLSRCFIDTVTSSILAGFLIIFGLSEILVYRKFSTPLPARPVKSQLFILQVVTLSVLTLLAIADALVQTYLVHNGTLYGYVLLTGLANTIIWPLSLRVVFLERNYMLPSIPTRGHGFILLVFWALAFVRENLYFVNLHSADWWFALETPKDQIELALFVGRYVATGVAFFLGLGAPGVYTAASRLYVDDESGTAGLLDQNAAETPPPAQQQVSPWSDLWKKLKTLFPFIWPKKSFALQARVLFCLLLLGVGRVANLYVPLLYKMLVDSMTISQTPVLVFRWDLVLIFVAVKFLQGGGTGGMGFLNNLRSLLWISVQQYTTKETEMRLFQHLHSLSLRWHLSRKTGEVLRVINRGTDSVNNLLSYLVFNILPTIADIVIAIIYFASAFNGWFSLIIFVTMAVYLASTIWVTEWRTKYKRLMNIQDNKLKARAVDSLLNFETVKYYGAEAYEVQRYRDIMDEYQKEEWKSTASLNLLNTVQNVVMTLGLLAGSMLCVKMAVDGELTVGDFVLFSTYIMQLYTPLNWFGTYYRVIQQSFIDMENMLELLQEKQEVKDNPGALPLFVREGQLEFRNVHFYYRPEKPILKDVSFTVPPGKTVALVGPSGEGKSTIIRLLFRFFDAQEGSILLDGQDVRGVTQVSLRHSIGVVPQDTVLFNDSIRYNIQYGRVNAKDEEIYDAARHADIHERIVSFPEGYNTVVGERGLKLSGGEKQRVAIARTLLKSPAFVLLDEATSALDTNTERNIQASLNKICANRTTLIVAHRLSTIIHADQILVLKDGQIAERGRHEELLDANGLYADMWNQQINSDESARVAE